MAPLMSRWLAKTRAFEQSFATDGHLIVNYRSVASLLGTSSPFSPLLAAHLTVCPTARRQHGVNGYIFLAGGLHVGTMSCSSTIYDTSLSSITRVLLHRARRRCIRI